MNVMLRSVLPSSDSHWDVCPSRQFSPAAFLALDPPPPPSYAHHQHCLRGVAQCILRPPQKPPSCISPGGQLPCTSRIPLTFAPLPAHAVFPPFLSPLSVCTSHLFALASHLPALASLLPALASLQIVAASRPTARIFPLALLVSLQIVSSLFSPRWPSASQHCLFAARHYLSLEASRPPQRLPHNCIGNPCWGCASRPF